MTQAVDPLTVLLPEGASSDPSPPVGVLILPALGVPARKYRALGEAIAARGVPAGLYELRGHGERPRATRAEDYGYTELLDEVGPAIAQFQERAGAGRVVLLGHSLGGQLALIHAALVAPVDVVFVAAGLPFWLDYSGLFRLTLLPLSQIVGAVAQVWRVSPSWNFGGVQSRGLMWDWAHTARTGRWPTIHGADPLEALGDARIRILAVHVEHDTYTPPAVMRRVLRAAGAAEITEYEYTQDVAGLALDHFTWTRAPQPLADVVVGFCRA